MFVFHKLYGSVKVFSPNHLMLFLYGQFFFFFLQNQVIEAEKGGNIYTATTSQIR